MSDPVSETLRPRPSPTRRPVLLALAAGLLAGAVGSGFMAWQARQQQAAVDEPSRLTALPEGALWLVMDDTMWRLDAEGAVTARLSAAQAGLPALPVRWAAVDSSLIALLADPTQALVLDARTGTLARRIPLQWPQALRSDAHTPSGLAVHPDGRMAVVLGQAGVLAVFSPQGDLLAHATLASLEMQGATRSPDDPLGFAPTQGIWWDGEDLWVSDAPGGALLRFRSEDLSLKGRTTFTRNAPTTYLTTAAVPHPHAGRAMVAPLATLVRRGHQHIEDQVTHVWPDGMEKVERLPEGARPADLAWTGETLVVAESQELRLRRFDIDRRPLSDLGDATVVQTLQHLRTIRDQAIHRMLGWVGAALAAGLGSLGLLAWAWRAGRDKAACVQDAAAPGPARWFGSHRPTWDRTLTEAFHRCEAWIAVRQDGEHLREHFEMAQGKLRRWVLLTNRRLVAFKPAHQSMVGWQLDKDWHRSDLDTISHCLYRHMSWTQRRQAPSRDGAWLRLKARDGDTLQGFVHPLSTAERFHAMVSLTARPPGTN